MSKLSYLKHIDSLRALAVLLVLLFHLDISFFQGGFIGVDVFFVISGFLITRIIRFEFENTDKINFKKFYLRRIRRLMPSLILTITISFILGFLIFSPSDLVNLTKSMFMSSIAVSNFHFLSEVNYFDTSSQFKPLLHTWSLGIEEQFYLLWPISLFILLEFTPKKVAPYIVGFILAGSLFLTIYFNLFGFSQSTLSFLSANKELTVDNQSIQFFLLPFRVYEFMCGALIAFIPYTKLKQEWISLLINIIGIVLVIIPAFTFSKDTPYLSTFNFLPCLGISILILFEPSKYFNFFFKSNLMKWIGDRSYTIYLIHWPLIVFYKYLLDKTLDGIDILIIVGIIIALSHIIYKYYETPLRYTTYKISIKSNPIFIGSYITIVFILLLTFKNVTSTQGYIWRLSQKNIKLVEEMDTPVNYHYKNWGGSGYKTERTLPYNSTNPEKVDMVWMGDSHAGHYMFAIDSLFVKKRKMQVHISNLSCFIVPGFKSISKNCTQDTQELLNNKLKILDANPDALFVISYYWAWRMIGASRYFDTLTNEFVKLDLTENSYQKLCEQLYEFRNIVDSDRKIVIIGESPKVPGNINYIEKLLRPKYLSSYSNVSASFELSTTNKELNAYMESFFVDKENFYFINPSIAFFNNEQNVVCQNGSKIYFSDINHLSKEGSVRAMEYMEDRFLEIITQE